MPSKAVSVVPPLVSVKKSVLEREAHSASFVTLRVKPDRRQSHLDVLAAHERRGAWQRSYRVDRNDR